MSVYVCMSLCVCVCISASVNLSPKLHARPAVTPATLKRAATNFAACKQRHNGC